MTDERGKDHSLAICGGLVLITLAVYAPALTHGFINYDDPLYVSSNPRVQQGLTGENIAWAFSTGFASNWHPLTWMSHMVDCDLFGLKPAGHHLTSLLLHAANTLLVFSLWRKLTGAVWRSAAVAALFAWHPLHVESVAWIAERKDVLSAFFFLLALREYVNYCASKRTETIPRTQPKKGRVEPAKSSRAMLHYSLALAFFVLGLLAKPMVVTLPFVLLLLDFWPLGRTGRDLTAKNAEIAEKPRLSMAASSQSLRSLRSLRLIVPSADWKGLVIEKIPFFALAAGSSLVTYLVQKHGGAVSSLQRFPLTDRVLNSVVSYTEYLAKMVWPVNLSIFYPVVNHWPLWEIITSFLVVIGMTTVALVTWRRRPYLAFGWFWYLGTLIPAIGLVHIGLQSMANRYTYIPFIGIFIMIAWGVEELCRNRPRWLPASVAGVALVALIIDTEWQLHYWKNSIALFQHAVAVSADNSTAYNNLGAALNEQGRTAEAIDCYERALEISPNYVGSLVNLADLLGRQGRLGEMIAYYRAGLKLEPDNAQLHNNLANIFFNLGRGEDAATEYQAAVKLKPDSPEFRLNYGTLLAQTGHREEARREWEEILRVHPDYAEARRRLGILEKMTKE